jgi:hypothetical protein
MSTKCFNNRSFNPLVMLWVITRFITSILPEKSRRPIMLDYNTKARVYTLPKCNICQKEAKYDAASFTGQWGYFCKYHFFTHTPGKLGLGVGQELILAQDPNKK